MANVSLKSNNGIPVKGESRYAYLLRGIAMTRNQVAAVYISDAETRIMFKRVSNALIDDVERAATKSIFDIANDSDIEDLISALSVARKRIGDLKKSWEDKRPEKKAEKPESQEEAKINLGDNL